MIKHKLDDLIEKFLEGRLTSEEKTDFLEICSHNPQIWERVEQEKELITLLQSTKIDSFGPHFSSRVIDRIQQEDTPSNKVINVQIMEMLDHLFPKVAYPALITAILILGFNFISAEANVSLIDALLGIPSPKFNVMEIF